jgi:hypothetical protein
MLNRLTGALGVAALVGFAWSAPASAYGGFGMAGGFGGGVHGSGTHGSGMHGGGFEGTRSGLSAVQGGGFPMRPGPAMRGSNAPGGPRKLSDSQSWNGRYWGHRSNHDGDHDRRHHRHDFYDDGYFLFGDADYDSGFELYADGDMGDYAANSQGDGYWYYCADSQSYYPYVTTCVSEWQQVTPPQPSPTDSGE